MGDPEPSGQIQLFGVNFFLLMCCPFITVDFLADSLRGERDGMTHKNLFPYRPVQTEVAWIIMKLNVSVYLSVSGVSSTSYKTLITSF